MNKQLLDKILGEFDKDFGWIVNEEDLSPTALTGKLLRSWIDKSITTAYKEGIKDGMEGAVGAIKEMNNS